MGDAGRRDAYLLVLAGAGIYAALTFVWFSLPAYLPVIIEEAELTGTEAGILAGAVPLTYIPLALFSGLAVDRIGPARSLAGALLLFGTGQALRSVATGFPSLLATTLLLGVGATVVTFGLPKLVAVLFPADETGLPSSVYLVGAAAGSATAYAVGRPIVGPWLGGWRPLFLWSGLLAVTGAVVWLALVRLTAPERTPEPPADGAGLGAVRRDVRTVLTHRDLRLVVVLGLAYLSILHGLQGWLPTILEGRGLAVHHAAQATTLVVIANVVGVLTIPGIADRFDARRVAVVASSATAALGVAGIIVGGTTAVTIAGIVAAGVGVGGLSPMVRAIPPALEGIGRRLTGTAVGLVFAVGEVGGFFGPVLIGLLHDATGSFLPGLAILSASGLAAMVAGSRLRAVGSPAPRR